MEATPCTTSHALINREHPVVTRHGLCSPHAETPLLRPMLSRTPVAKVRGACNEYPPQPDPDPRPRSRKASLPDPCRPHRRPRDPIITERQKPKSPQTTRATPQV